MRDKTWFRRRRFFPYDYGEALLSDMSDLLEEDPDEVKPACMLITGQSDTGKSALLREFLDRHPARPNPEGNAFQRPVICINVPEGGSETKLWSRAFAALGSPKIGTGNAGDREQAFLRLLRNVGVKVICLDEIHNLQSRGASSQRKALVLLKDFANEVGVPIIATGTPVARTVIKQDDQFLSRFDTHELLPWDDPLRVATLLCAYERELGFDGETVLVEEDVIDWVIASAAGQLGAIVKRFKRAAWRAYENGRDHVAFEDLKKVRVKTVGENARLTS